MFRFDDRAWSFSLHLRFHDCSALLRALVKSASQDHFLGMGFPGVEKLLKVAQHVRAQRIDLADFDHKNQLSLSVHRSGKWRCLPP